MRKAGAVATVLLVAGCGGGSDADEQAEANKPRIECALEGAKSFERNCTAEEIHGAGGDILIVGRSDVGYRRLQITTDGRGVISADGAEAAKVAIVDDGVIEVAIGADRYRLPANTKGSK